MPALPQLDGVRFRNFGGSADYEHLARIITASSQGEDDDRVETPEALASSYDHLDRCDPATDILVAEVDGRPVGYSRVWWDQEPDGPRVYRQVCFLDPATAAAASARRSSPGTRCGCARSPRSTTFPRRSSKPGPTTGTSCDCADPRRRLRARRARGPDGQALGRRPSRPFAPRTGLELRPVRDEDIRPIWDADIEAFRDHWGYFEPTEEGYESFRAFPYLDPTLWKVAWDDEGVAGQVKSFIDTAQNEEHGRKRGYTEAIATARRWRRRGVAKALIVESIRELAERGMTEVALGVHTENPNGAYDLYAGLGYEVVKTWTTYRRPF